MNTPIIKGGQGRSAQEVENSALAIVVLSAILIVVGAITWLAS